MQDAKSNLSLDTDVHQQMMFWHK